MKKTISAVLAILLCMVFMFAGCKDNSAIGNGGVVENTDDLGNVVSLDDANAPKSDVDIKEGETTYEEQLGREVEIFMNGSYCLNGTIYSGGEVMPVVLATDGENIELTVEISDINFGVLMLDDSAYVVQPEQKKYTELSNTLLNVLGLDDSMNVADLQNIKNSGTDEDDDAKRVQFAVTINGEPGLCTEFVYNDTFIKLYSIGDELIQVENYDENNKLTMQVVVDSITDQIPADRLTIKGLEKVSVTKFLQSLIQ